MCPAGVSVAFQFTHASRKQALWPIQVQAIEEYVSGQVVKYEPMSNGHYNQRKRKPHILAVTTRNLYGMFRISCLRNYWPCEDCMYWSPDPDHAPFGRIIVDPLLCIGCKLCTSKGPDGAFLEGCPWDAIDMVPTARCTRRNAGRFPLRFRFSSSFFYSLIRLASSLPPPGLLGFVFAPF